MRSFLLFIGFCLMAPAAVCQRQDTTYLKEVVVFGLPVTQYATGSKVQKISSGDHVSTLADGLTGEASLYLKTYGNGQLTTIALRGTNASQTAVLWNGVNINSPTLGQTDFSLIPLFLFDEVSLHYGTASSLYGSDAIGGSVMLGNAAAEFRKTFRAGVSQEIGSFGRTGTGIKATYGNERLEFRTKLYRAYVRNDFPFRAPAVGYRKKQVNAAVTNGGFDQQAHFKISEQQTLSAEVMYTDNFREVQPAVTSDQDETMQDRHIRAALNYNNNAAWATHATAAYISADQHFTRAGGETSNVRTHQLAAQINTDKQLSYRGHLRFGASYNYYTVVSASFDHPQEARYDAFASYRYAIAEPWIVNLNIRQTFYDRQYAPFAPSLGTEVYLRKKENSKLVLRALSSRGYRVPTLNDRYYIPGGDPLTTPEKAIHAEGGLVWSETLRHVAFKLDATYYHSWINQMITWLPDNNGIWSASNLQKVNIRGAELSLRTENTSGPIKITSGAVYSFTQSLNKKSLSPSMDNKQLPYVPVHSANIFSTFSNRKQWKLEARYTYMGLRYNDLDNTDYQSLKPYGLVDISLGKKLAFAEWSAVVRAEARNLADVYYENLKNHAMPGRNYAISLLINF